MFVLDVECLMVLYLEILKFSHYPKATLGFGPVLSSIVHSIELSVIQLNYFISIKLFLIPLNSDMKYVADTDIFIDCRNFMIAALNCSLIRFLKLKYYGTFTSFKQYAHSNAHITPIKDIFSAKPHSVGHHPTNLPKFGSS